MIMAHPKNIFATLKRKNMKVSLILSKFIMFDT